MEQNSNTQTLAASDVSALAKLASAANERPSAASGVAVRRPPRALYALLGLALAASIALGLVVGRSGIGLVGLDSVFFSMRAHRVIVGFCCGAALSVAGVAVQALFHNPLASPWILGTSSGATLGAHVALLAVALMLGNGSTLGMAPEMMVPIGAVAGAALSLFALLSAVSFRSGPLTLLLTGFAFNALFEGAGTFLTNLFQEAWELNRAVAALQVGNISSVGTRQTLLAVIMALGGCLPIFFAHDSLDVLLSGDEEAQTLGVDVKQTRFWLVTWVAIATAGAVAVGGSVAMVGLIVPHVLRPWVGQRHRYLLPASFVTGGVFIVLCDVMCRLVPVRLELPLGVLVDLIGAPIFLRLLTRAARSEVSHA